MIFRKFFMISCVFLSAVLFPGFLSALAVIPGVELLYSPQVIDARVQGGMRERSGNAPAKNYDLKQLEVGDIFITEDNQARKVTAVYSERGKTIIETVEPRPEEVIYGVYVPDFDLTLDDANIQAFFPGVSPMIQGSPAEEAENLLALSANEINPPAGVNAARVEWLETDPNSEGLEHMTPWRIDIPLWKGSVSKGDMELLEKITTAGKTNGTNSGTNTPADPQQTVDDAAADAGKPGIDLGAAGEIRLTGVLRPTEPRVTGGLKSPSMKVSWITHWWHPPIPKFSFTKGYARAQVDMAQQFDFKITGTLSLSAEVDIPLAVAAVADPSGTVMFMVTLSARINLDGTISLGAEISEYTYMMVEGKCDLVWPFIPTRVSADSDFYMNAAFRPIVAASAELRGGLYITGSFLVAGINIVSLSGGGGVYIMATGYMEPLGVMGYATDYGGYGNFDEWILYVTAEAGGFAVITAKVLFWSKDLYFQRWPFWTYANQWEFL